MTIKHTTFLIMGLLLCACTQRNYTDANVSKRERSGENSAIVVPADFKYPQDSTFKVLSWNVEHFVDPYDDPYINNEREDNPPENMPQRLHLLVDALRKADADIVVLQEFESAKYLEKIANDSLPDMQYRFFADVPSHSWYMNVVIMSRFPMGVISGYGNATTPLPGYIAEDGSQETQNQINTRMWSVDVFPSEDYAFLLTGVHLKAGRGERNVAMRKGQINLLVTQFNRILRENPEENMMVAGDLNATPGSEEIGLLLASDQLSEKFVDAIDTSVYSHPSDHPSRRLDHMLVNENMYAEAVKDSIQVEHFFSSDTMRIISDHLPVVGYFYNH